MSIVKSGIVISRISFALVKPILVLVVVALSLGACANRKIVNITFPEVGLVTTIGIGENLVTQGDGIALPVLIISKDQAIGDITLRKGKYASTAENSELIRFGQVANDGAIEPPQRKVPIHLMKKDKTICAGKNLCAPMEYTLGTTISPKSVKSFQQTLLYNGKIGNRITLGYREFSNNLARPAFSNAVDYDLSGSPILGYKGARIEVIKATNTEITYKVLSGFE